jgi:hypothetical protein
MRVLKKLALAAGFSIAALSATAAYADSESKGDEQRHEWRGDDDGYRGGDDDDDDGYRGRGGYDGDDRGGWGGYDRGRPARCDVDHDHRSHDPRYYDYWPRDRYYDGRGGRYDHDHYGYGRSRVIRRDVFDTRYRARIYLTEEEFYTRGGRYRVCTLEVRGPDRRYVPYGQVRSLANRQCSRRSEIRIH